MDEREKKKRSSLGKGIGEAYEQNTGRLASRRGGKGKPHDDLVPLTTSRRGRLQIITWAWLGFGTAGRLAKLP